MRALIKTREIVKSVGGFRLHEENQYIVDYENIIVARSGDLCIAVPGKRQRHLALSEISDVCFYS